MPQLVVLAVLALVAGLAFAVAPQPVQDSARAGFLAPFSASDHLLVLSAVGLLAATSARPCILVLPLAFAVSMAIGVELGATGRLLAVSEALSLVSIVILGTLLAFGVAPRIGSASALVAMFGLAHGFAHSGKPKDDLLVPFTLGNLAAALLIQALCFLLAASLIRLLDREDAGLPLRFLGAGLGLGGLSLALTG